MSPREYAAQLKWSTASFFDEPKAMTSSEAVYASLDQYGHIEPTFIEEMTGLSIQDAALKVPDMLYFNPITGGWEDSDEWLCGDVITKHREASANMDRWEGADRHEAERAMKALANVRPATVPFKDISVKFGTRWVPTRYYREFICHFFGCDGMMDLIPLVYCSVTDNYIGSCDFAGRYKDMSMSDCYPCDVIMYALRHSLPAGKEKQDFVRSRLPIIECEWQAYLNLPENEKKRKRIERIYNEAFNCEVRPRYDGSFQTLPDLDLEGLGIKDLYPSQKDCIYMIKRNYGSAIAWHQVGTGKTLIQCIAAYECHRTGVSPKPLIIGMKANVAQIAETFRKAYPHAKLLFPKSSDFSKKNYTALMNRIKDEDWDCIIMSHDQFCKLPQARGSELVQMERDAEAMKDVLVRLNDMGEYDTQYLRKYEDLLTRIKELKDELRNDHSTRFSDLGITNIFVDESHIFKALKFKTRDLRVGGIGNPLGSGKAQILCNAIRDIQQRTGRELGATFLSGTIVSNSLTELYCIFNYLRPRALARQKIYSFDAWASTFTDKTVDFDLNMLGQTVAKEKFTSYINVPEMSRFLAQICDYRTTEMCGIDAPKERTHTVIMPPTPNQKLMMDRLVKFVDKAKEHKVIDWAMLGINAEVPKNIDKSLMLTVTDLCRKVAMDPRMLDNCSTFGDEEGCRARVCAKNIYDIYCETNDQKGTQFVFSDFSTYDKSKWNVQSAIRDILVNEYGIPSDEVVFINAVSDSKRLETFEKMNNGQIRVLFGSTARLGTGVNAQERAVAIHHLDVTWRTSDMEQRNGRALRQGNRLAKERGNVVDVFYYATQGTMDPWKLGILRLKSSFIYQLNNGSCVVRRIDGSVSKDDESLTWAEFQNAVTGNQDLLTKTKLTAKILSLESLRSKFYANRLDLLTSTRLTDKQRKEIEQSTWDGEAQLAALKSELDALNSKIMESINGKDKDKTAA